MMNENNFQNPTPEGEQPQENQTMPPKANFTSPTLPRRTHWWLIPVSLMVGCLPWVILFFVFIAAIIGGLANVERGGNVALIRVSGVITGGESDHSPFGSSSTGSEDLIADLEKARKNKDVKAIVLRINSPGGSAAGSEEVYNEIVRIQKSGKPIYTSMGDVAASGGYYIASACDKIYADANTLTGSIGVIFQTSDLSGLFKKIGINPETIKSGKFKDIGSPNRPITPAERELLQGMIMDIYNNFTKAVADGRKIPIDDVKKIADGRIFTGGQALNAKLIDKIGGLHETIKQAAVAGGISGEPKVVEYGGKGFLGSILSGSDNSSSQIDKAVSKEILEKLLRRDGIIQDLR